MRRPFKKAPSLPGFDSDLEPENPLCPPPETSTSFTQLVGNPVPKPESFVERVRPVSDPVISSGEKSKARDIIAAIRTLKKLEHLRCPPDDDERALLARFCGFGPVALSIFPNPVTGQYKDGWSDIGEELKSLLTPEEYDSAKRTTFSQFFTSPTVMSAMHGALKRLGVTTRATVLEPGAGIGNFMNVDCQPYDKDCKGYRWIGVELDSISGRIARLLHPKAEIRIENFQDTRLPELDAVIGNVPFADLKLDHKGQKFSLHDYFFAKSVDALKPGGVMALVTSHYTLDKQNGAIREYLASKADFIGAIRLPSDALELTSQYPRKESITGLPPAWNTQAGRRSSVHLIGWDGASA
jgi:hypothetical protein